MNPSDEERDALTDEYRHASAEDAGRPGAALRKAILAEAAAAARQRAPAANDSRYLWRGVAGIAVLGFAVLMWKQVDHRMPGEAPVVAAQPMQAESDAGPAARPATVGNTASLAEPRPAVPSVAQADAPPATMADKADAAAPAPEFAPQRATEAESSAAEGFRNESRALGKMSAAQDAETDADALLRRYFPAQYESNSMHSVWLVQNANGEVLRSGELAAGRTFSDLRPEIERELGGTLLRPWRIRSLPNAHGQVIEFAIAQTP